MARIAARNLRLYLGLASDTAAAEPVAFISKLTINSETDDFEVTAGGDTNKVYVSGLPDASGTYNGFYDTATVQTYTASTDGLARRFYIYPTTPSTAGPYWFGTGFWDFALDLDVAGPAAINGSWKAASGLFKVG